MITVENYKAFHCVMKITPKTKCVPPLEIEGVLFEVENEKMFFHNGTDRAAVLIAAAEAAAEVVGSMNPNEEEKALIIFNIHKRIYGRKDACADFKINTGG